MSLTLSLTLSCFSDHGVKSFLFLLNFFRRFLRSDTLEQIKFKLEKVIGIYKDEKSIISMKTDKLTAIEEKNSKIAWKNNKFAADGKIQSIAFFYKLGMVVLFYFSSFYRTITYICLENILNPHYT